MTLEEGIIGKAPLEMDAMERQAKRFWLSGMAMQALVQAGMTDIGNIAHQSFSMADAMLEVEGDVRKA